jgi:RHH-type transcriptional regulator, rel operon repressor / antitoxin RelB
MILENKTKMLYNEIHILHCISLKDFIMAVPNPQEKEPVSFRLKKQIKDDLAKLSEATGRPQTFLVEEALQDYIDLNMWQINAIQQGIKSADEGKLYSTEEVLDFLEKKRV